MAFTEAPASATLKYRDRTGFEIMFTLRDGTGMELLKKVEALTDELNARGYEPVMNGYHRNGNGSSKAKVKANTSNHICPIHGVPMKRWEKDGKVWYSHKLEDGSWCNGT